MFEQARLKLTIWYVVVIMLVSGFFSSLVYWAGVRELSRYGLRWERQMMHRERLWQKMMGEEMMEGWDRVVEWKEKELNEAKKSLIIALIELNGVILVLAMVSGWFLAGKTLAPIKKSMEEQKLFAASAAHELKTPLTVMKANLEVALEDKKIDDKVKQILKENLEEVDRLISLSQGLLSLSYPQTAKEREEVNVNQVVKEITKRFQGQAKQKDIDLKIQERTKVEIYGNKKQVEKMLEAVIDNAIKYSHKGGKVVIQVDKEGKFGVIRIKDWGVGIKREDINKVKKPFYQVTSTNNGFGLGLAIVDKIVKDHGGKWSIQSEEGEGAEVEIKLSKK